MNDKCIKALEYDKIAAEVAGFTSSSAAGRKLCAFVPQGDFDEASRLLTQTFEADKALYEYSVSPNFAVDDISDCLERAKVLSTLTMGELLKIARVLKVGREIAAGIEKVPDVVEIKNIASGLYTDKQLEDDIFTAILSENEMSDKASPELRAVRAKIRRLNESIKAKLNEFVTSATYSKYLQDNIVTVRGDRYVIPVKTEFKGAIAGLVHDQSASGQTLYIEPVQIVEYNNELKSCLIEEKQEIEKILKAFTFRISSEADFIACNFATVLTLDGIFARAKYSRFMGGVMPVLNTDGYINIVKGRHPLIDKEKVVPVSVYIGKEFRILLITGPNTGGKTVTLKLVGLFTLMALSGLFLPAAAAEIAVFKEVFCDIGDEQSIEQSLSTFSGHIKNIIEITDKTDKNCLLLLDELGAGTDPSEGAALALAIADYIKAQGATAIITSHYNELKEYGLSTEGVENASMDFDAKTFAPTFGITIGLAGASNALHIAKRLGINPTILEKAKELVSKETKDFNHILLSAERAKQKAEKLTETARINKSQTELELKRAQEERDALKKKAEQINESIRKETKRLIDDSVSEAEEIIGQMKDLLKRADEAALFEARKLKKKLENMSAEYVSESQFRNPDEEEEGEIKVGDRVLYVPLNAKAIVHSVSKDKVTLKMGAVTSNVKLKDCKRLKAAPQQPPKSKGDGKRELNTALFKPEVNVIGQSVEEALYNVENFLDKAQIAGVQDLRIVHGKGTGALRKAVRELLSGHYAVKEFRDGLYGEGEKGVTIVKLK